MYWGKRGIKNRKPPANGILTNFRISYPIFDIIEMRDIVVNSTEFFHFLKNRKFQDNEEKSEVSESFMQ